jgi:hypothetical protein
MPTITYRASDANGPRAATLQTVSRQAGEPPASSTDTGVTAQITHSLHQVRGL